MEQSQLQRIAIGAGVVAVLVALMTGRMPRWLRVLLVFAVVVLAGGAGLYGYRTYTTPRTLTVAVGSLDSDVPRMMSAIAARIAAANAPVRLKVVDKGTALEAVKAFTSGETDLAIARADVGDLSAARTLVVVSHGVALIVAPPGSTATSIDDFKGKTIGVVGIEVNKRIIDALTKEYELDQAKVRFRGLTIDEIAPALKSRQVAAVMAVLPISDKYLKLLRELFPRTAKQKPTLIPIESAGAIATLTKYYESYDLPKGTLQGSPPIPDDDMTTLRVPLYLLANKKLSDDTAGAVAKAVMDARHDLVNEYPVLAQIAAPNTDKDTTDKDAYVPIHPGAAAYFDGDTKTFFDKYGDQIFYGSMLLGSLTSLFAAAWKFMTRDDGGPERHPVMTLFALADEIGRAADEAELAAVEQRINDALKAELAREAAGSAEPADAQAFGLAMQRLEYLVGQRRLVLARTPVRQAAE